MTLKFETQEGFSVGRSPLDAGSDAVSRNAWFDGIHERIGWGGSVHPELQTEPIQIKVYRMRGDGGISYEVVETYNVLGKPQGEGGQVNGYDLKPGSEIKSRLGTVITSG